MTFDLSRLAAKQKRLMDWSRFTSQEVQDPALRKSIETKLSEFKEALALCWKENAVSPELARRIDDLERSLEELNETARLHVS